MSLTACANPSHREGGGLQRAGWGHFNISIPTRLASLGTFPCARDGACSRGLAPLERRVQPAVHLERVAFKNPRLVGRAQLGLVDKALGRSEERRVGKECRSR